ncbi:MULTISPECIES: methyltransferase domain-containing protein [unclassified Pseudoxanthomonas]|uniref:class I SAM-dependent methyltransferase n=1 Tax=unclassified Pseudoxanthomonas TaxID=2645906 RepID=UPI0008DECEC8|nr:MULTISPECIES: methyltransferase domain-containing protein [unclassified Pseudoxanthomonas]SFV34921.1 Methyltransferase domain-containing protein [Pseudoxanthomonas sp. YR558]
MNLPISQPAGNHYDKYGTRNPIARQLMHGFLSDFDRLAAHVPAGDALEVGCGEGELSIRLARKGRRVKGCDIAGEVVDEARRRAELAGVDISFRVEGIQSLTPADACPLVVCCEVLEHLDDPEAGLDTLAELASPWLLTSVPREPIWRVMNMARGKYLADWGNTPGHLNHWSRKGFLKFLGRRFDIVQVASPLPWTMALCRSR